MIIKLENRLIAFLDVLGFSARLESENIEVLHGQYSAFIDEAKIKTFYLTEGDSLGRKNFDFSQFLFDSIVLVSCPIDDIYNVNNFVAAISFLMELGFKNKLPLRGAISCGNFLYDDERNIFLSERFPELAKFELQQEWAGCSILEHAEAVVLNAAMGGEEVQAGTQLRNQPFHRYPVPLKNGKTKECLVLNFLFFLDQDVVLEGIDYLISDKKENNIEYLNFLINMPIELNSLPAEFLPATYMAAVKTRSGFRVKFCDEYSNICVPGVSTINYIAVGRWKA